MSRASSYGMATTTVAAKVHPFLKPAIFFQKKIFPTCKPKQLTINN
jgi:hypothetical protein